MKFAGKQKKISTLPDLSEHISPYLPRNISELLPETNGTDAKVTFVAVGPMLIDALAAGKNLLEAAEDAHLNPTDAMKLLATPEFAKYVEAYLSIGDLTDKDARIRLGKAILASMIANGVVSKKKDPLDILDYIRRETEVKRGAGHSVHVNLINRSVPRPYSVKDVTAIAVETQIENGGE